MQDMDLVQKVQGLTDIELAVLLSLVASQHCIIETEEEAIDALAEELQLVSKASLAAMASHITYTSIDCLEYLQSSPNGGLLLKDHHP